MKVLLIEDDKTKVSAITGFILSKAGNGKFNFIVSDNLSDARRKIIAEKFDLIIFDIYMPMSSSSSDTVDISEDIINEFTESKNYRSEAIALTKYDIDGIENINIFNEAGVTIIHLRER